MWYKYNKKRIVEASSNCSIEGLLLKREKTVNVLEAESTLLLLFCGSNGRRTFFGICGTSTIKNASSRMAPLHTFGISQNSCVTWCVNIREQLQSVSGHSS